MCNFGFLQEHPCDHPYMPDTEGACTVLIADHIHAQGPSRYVFIGYWGIISLTCFALSLRRLYEITHASPLWRQERRWELLREHKVLAVVTQTYASLVLVILGIDPSGYDNRMPFVAWAVLQDQAGLGLNLSAGLTLCLWHTAVGEPGEAEGRRKEAQMFLRVLVLTMGCVTTVGPALAVVWRPAVVPLGVYNGIIVAIKSTAADVICWVAVYFLARIYYNMWKGSQTSKRAMQATRITPEDEKTATYPMNRLGSPAGRSRVPTSPMGSRAAVATSGPLPRTKIPGGAATDLASTPPAPPTATRVAKRNARRDSAPSMAPSGASGTRGTHGIRGDAVSGESQAVTASRSRAFHQMRKFVAITLVIIILGTLRSITGSIRSAHDCWSWTPPPDEQWYEAIPTVYLLMATGLAVAPLKTYTVCDWCRRRTERSAAIRHTAQVRSTLTFRADGPLGPGAATTPKAMTPVNKTRRSAAARASFVMAEHP